MKYHAITADTPKQIIFDAGVVYRNFVSPEEPGELLGATRGGSQFNLNLEQREIEADAVPGPVKGFKRLRWVEASVTVNMLSLTLDNLKAAIPGGVSEPGQNGFEGYDKVTAKQITDDSYLDNLALVARTGAGRPAILVIENALADGTLGISLVDDDESNPAVTFTAHFAPEVLETLDDPFDALPFGIYWPSPAQADNGEGGNDD